MQKSKMRIKHKKKLHLPDGRNEDKVRSECVHCSGPVPPLRALTQIRPGRRGESWEKEGYFPISPGLKVRRNMRHCEYF